MMVIVTVIAILAAVAVPGYFDYRVHSRLEAGATVLKTARERMQASYALNRTYALAGGGCAVANFSDPESEFSIACTITAGGQGFRLTATGTGPASGFQFGINEAGVERTLAVKAGWSGASLPATRFILRRE